MASNSASLTSPTSPTSLNDPTTRPDDIILESISEIFVFDYGVVVLWGFTREQEGQLLHHLAPFEDEKLRKYSTFMCSIFSLIPIIMIIIAPGEIELEEFHFHYNKEGQPR
jgi:uncharacterized Rmd1/YagE family protein